MGLFYDFQLHLVPEHLVLEPPALMHTAGLECALLGASPSSAGHGLCVEPGVHIEFSHSGCSCYGSAMVLYIIPLHTLEQLQVHTSLPHCLCLTSRHRVETQTGYGFTRVTSIMLLFLCMAH